MFIAGVLPSCFQCFQTDREDRVLECLLPLGVGAPRLGLLPVGALHIAYRRLLVAH